MRWFGIVAVACLAIAGCYGANNACSTGPCQSGGTCTAFGSSYSCACPAGYAGNNCQFQACDQWSNSISIGATSNTAAGLDGAERWTMIQKEGFSTEGTLVGFKFYAKYIRPLTIGIYRPTGGVCSFTLVGLFSANIRETGLITFSLTPDQQITVKQNDTVGITWTKYGVVPYDTVTPYLFCDDNLSPPAVGGVITLQEKKYGQRAYSLQAMIVPTAPILPGPYLGYSPTNRAAVPSGQLWTVVQTSGFPLAGTLTGFEFYVQAARPVQLGLYRPVSGCTFRLLKSWSPAVSAVGLVRLSFTGNDVAQFQKDDTIGLTWTNYGSVPYDNADDFNYCDNSLGQPAVGSELALSPAKYGNRFYSLRAIAQFKLSTSCSSNPCQNGGACCNSGDSYYCQCPSGTVQPNCAKATNCLQSPCINGGTCVAVTRTSYTCACLPGYTGINCETRPCDDSVVQSIGYAPVYRSGLDGGLRTMIQTKGFPTAGVMTGYRFYAQIIRNLQVGLYRSQGNCRYQLIKGWTRAVINEGVQTVRFSLSEQANFEAGDTIGFTWTSGGVVPYNDYYGVNYCEDDVAQPSIGATIDLGAPVYGSRVYSFEGLYISNGPGPAPSFLGFNIVPGTVDGAAVFTFIQIRGFQAAGTLVGFKFQVGVVRPLALGLYRPVPGTCTYQLLKGWTPYINSLGQMDVYFTASDRANFQVGDTYGFSWANGGVIPYDGSSDYNYCENAVAQPAVGTTVTLLPGRYGNRFYSIRALYIPATSTTTCLAPTDCSPNPCQNGGACDLDDLEGFVCTCREGYSGNNCEVPPASQPCTVSSSFNASTSQWIGYQAFDRLTVDGGLYTFVQSKGFPSAGILTGFQFFAKYMRPLTLGLYRRVDGCTFKLLKSFAPRISAVGVVTYQLSGGEQVVFQEGDTIGFSWTSGGVITFDAASANDYLYCENNVAPPSVGTSFNLVAGRYGNRLYSIRALYTPTSLAPQPLTLGWNPVSRGGADGAAMWTYVQIDGFQTDGTLQGFQFYVSQIRPLTLGLYRPVGGTCSYTLLKVYSPPVVNTGVNTFTLSPKDQYRFQAGDTIGLTWTNYGVVSYEAATGQLYCEDRQAVTTEGATMTLFSNRYGKRFLSLQALYRPVTSTGYYVDYCANSPCQNGGSCCSSTTSFECTCPSNTIPPNCAPSDPCKSSPCANGGGCTKISQTAFSCSCKLGFNSDDCSEVVPNPCDKSPCNNGGSCTRLDNSNYKCTCTSRYIGTNCQTAIQPCSSSPCQNGGICSGSSTSYTCACPIGYTGTTCNSVVPDPCASSPCSNEGVCTRITSTTFSCTCSSSYTGSKCETALACASSPCQNGGTCTNLGTTDFECNCPDDYNDGDTCSTYQDPCLSSPCQNGGTCTRQTWNTYTCYCPQGWVGQLCELNPGIPPCDNLPCQHGGTCSNGEGLSYMCKCPQMWEGQSCNIVHCLPDEKQCNSTSPPLGGRFARCDNCAQFVACRKKRQRTVTCSLYPVFDRTVRKCSNNTATACIGL